MKENDVQPTNSGRPEDDFGQAQDQNPNVTPDPVTPEENENLPETPDSDRNSDTNLDPVRDDLTPLDDTTEQTTVSPGTITSDGGVNQAPPAGGGSGSKGWMIASIVLAAALIVVLIANPFAKDTGKEAVATVNNVDITKNNLYDSLVEAGGEQTLQALITKELVKQELDKKSIVITDAQVDEEVASVKGMFPSEEEFNTALSSSGMTLDNLKEQTKLQLEMTQLMGDKAKVTDEEVKEIYDQYKDSFATPEQVRASHILVETKEEAQAIIKELQGGADFAAIAKEKNQDATKETGGDLNFFARDSGMDAAFEEAAFKLKKGELATEPVKSSFGYHVIKVTDRKEATNPTLEDKKEEIRKQLVSTKVNEQSTAFMQELKDKAKITNTLVTEKKNDKAEAPTEAPAK